MIKVNINKKENLIYLDNIGEIELVDIFSVIKKLTDSFDNDNYIYILTDMKKALPKFTIEDLPVIISEIADKSRHFKHIWVAYLVNDPPNTVIGLLMEDMSQKLTNYTVKTFSTKPAAMRWLKTFSHSK